MLRAKRSACMRDKDGVMCVCEGLSECVCVLAVGLLCCMVGIFSVG